MGRRFILIGILLYLVGGAYAQSVEDLNLSSGLMAKGYDVVSYFDQEAIRGKSNFELTYQGAKYRFSSRENMEKFKNNPEKYAPQYGGWCAYAMGEKGEKVDINPKTFEIMDGKLYLFYDKFLTNTKDYWDKDPQGLRIKADKNWNAIIKKE